MPGAGGWGAPPLVRSRRLRSDTAGRSQSTAACRPETGPTDTGSCGADPRPDRTSGRRRREKGHQPRGQGFMPRPRPPPTASGWRPEFETCPRRGANHRFEASRYLIDFITGILGVSPGSAPLDCHPGVDSNQHGFDLLSRTWRAQLPSGRHGQGKAISAPWHRIRPNPLVRVRVLDAASVR